MKPEGRHTVIAMASPDMFDEPLPYRVELWAVDGSPERVIGRAASIVLARAIFAAAQVDFVQARIALCRGSEVLMQSDTSS